MGWSYAMKAGWVMDSWTDACLKSTGSQNTWKQGTDTYFFEATRKNNRDSSITGSIWKFLPDGSHCHKTGSFKINPDGAVARAPKFLKSHSPSKEEIQKRYDEFCNPLRLCPAPKKEPMFQVI